jgi:demethylmenaquinone methyltransferase/2-methoxy-6-polyprenyl-1,4-benzoquinol methylase
MRGTLAPGAVNEQQSARWVRDMFGRVAPRYDFANHLLSLNIDRRWRDRTVARVRDVLIRPEARIADVCCGTGDLTLALSMARGSSVLGSDFCAPMLDRAAQKLSAHHLAPRLFEADAMRLPFGDGSLDLITCAFGFRNLTGYDAGLREFRRVLRAGGKLAILEFSQPPNRSFGALYSFYSNQILPRIGGILSGARDAYTYLPESVEKFPNAEELARGMRDAGFLQVSFEHMTGGIVALHIGVA